MLDRGNGYGHIPEHSDYLEDDSQKSEKDDVGNHPVSVIPIILRKLKIIRFLRIKIRELTVGCLSI